MRPTLLIAALLAGCALPDAADVCYETNNAAMRAADGTACPASTSPIGYSLLGPNVMLVVDRSNSMKGSKWGAVQGLTPFLPMVGERANLGLSVFPGEGRKSCGTPGKFLVPIGVGDRAANDVTSALASASPGGSTPMGAALKDLRREPSLQCPNRDNIVVLLTDGVESCGGDPVKQAERLTTDLVPVELYVIGFGTSEMDNQSLRDVANAGNTHTGPNNFFTASTVEDLIARLAAVTGSCRIQLDTDVDPGDLLVTMDGRSIAACDDARCEQGFTYDPEHAVVQFEGNDCLALQDGTCHDLSFDS